MLYRGVTAYIYGKRDILNCVVEFPQFSIAFSWREVTETSRRPIQYNE